MTEVSNNTILTVLYDISKKMVLPMYQNLKDEDIMYKDNSDLVTSVDIKIEEELNKILLQIIPNSLFVGEEIVSREPNVIDNYNYNNYCWTVDPIDGTKNFIRGKDKFAIMIGLTFKEKIIQSWIYRPLTEEFCYAKLDEGSYINNKKIYIENDTDISKAVGSISSKYWENNLLNKIQNLKRSFNYINSYGCIGIEYIDIVKGLRDFAILSKLSPWDHIPGILFVKEAGGAITHFDKKDYNHIKKKNNLIVTNSFLLQDEIINLIKE